MATSWHVASADYNAGEDLLCWKEMLDRGLTVEAGSGRTPKRAPTATWSASTGTPRAASEHVALYPPDGIILASTSRLRSR
jgi:hypothetical protein